MLSKLFSFIIFVVTWPFGLYVLWTLDDFRLAFKNMNKYYDMAGVETLIGLVILLVLLAIAAALQVFDVGFGWLIYTALYLLGGIIFFWTTSRARFKNMLRYASPYSCPV